ncbi:hypothetical protein D1007_15091 [Hordeum vulgare]|nr:hypothetical protein D1007_15091 [Hordeum vulgare]
MAGSPTPSMTANPSDAHSATSGASTAVSKVDMGEFFDHLDLNDADFDDVVVDEDDPDINESVRWLALARVHTRKTFCQSGFYKDMRAAWNPAQSARFRPVGPNLYLVP